MFFGGSCGHEGRHAGRGGWAAFDPSAMGFMWPGGPGGGRRGGPFRGGRVFEQGDLKYVILQLLEEKPRHGYEVIKELEDRFSGTYSPSPGTVYPTLTMLEDLGYARAIPEEGGKKIYEITDAGRAYLAENRGTVDDIFARIAKFGASFFTEEMGGVHRAFGEVARSTFSLAGRHARDTERLKRMKEILERAAREIEDAGK
ncbi:MAG: PadR family transcriptional regulator [Gemmatimonadota bacterium]|nr:PadR family transcriptional regulator [Gemmatimonadota bacterium]